MVLEGLLLCSGRESTDVQAFEEIDTVEDLKHDDIASGLPFVPISLVRLIWHVRMQNTVSSLLP